MGKKKHDRKNKAIYPFIPVGILPDIQPTILTGPEQNLCFCGGMVRTGRVTSKGVPLDRRRHYNNPIIQRYCGREVLIFDAGKTVTAYVHEPAGPTLIQIMYVTREQSPLDRQAQAGVTATVSEETIQGGGGSIMKKLAAVSIDEKEQIFLNGKLLENVTAYKLENSASSKEPAKLTVTMFVNVGQACPVSQR